MEKAGDPVSGPRPFRKPRGVKRSPKPPTSKCVRASCATNTKKMWRQKIEKKETRRDEQNWRSYRRSSELMNFPPKVVAPTTRWSSRLRLRSVRSALQCSLTMGGKCFLLKTRNHADRFRHARKIACAAGVTYRSFCER